MPDSLAIAVEALTSIGKNTCCDSCQEAARVAQRALAQIASIRSTEPSRELLPMFIEGHLTDRVLAGDYLDPADGQVKNKFASPADQKEDGR